jgi:hypothetical protein
MLCLFLKPEDGSGLCGVQVRVIEGGQGFIDGIHTVGHFRQVCGISRKAQRFEHGSNFFRGEVWHDISPVSRVSLWRHAIAAAAERQRGLALATYVLSDYTV